MLITPEEGLKIIEKKYINHLRACRTVKERYDKLMELFPDSIFWDPMPTRYLVYHLHIHHKLDFGVCRFYSYENGKQFCSATAEKIECLCAIPEIYCVARDRISGKRYEETGH